jgi:acyl-CoA thioesterase-1
MRLLRSGARQPTTAQSASYWVAGATFQGRRDFMALLTAAGTSLWLGAGAPAAQAAEAPIRVVALGDSLTAGFGLPAEDSFAAKLQAALRANGYAVEINNAGVSGDTTTGGLARLEWSVPEGTEAVILELGANDALRGLDPDVSRRALDEIMRRLTARSIPVLLCGMLAPPNLGTEYEQRFNSIFPDLAETYRASLYPFFLQDVAGLAELNQRDGLHPTAAGIDIIVRNILPQAEQLIAKARERRNG